MGGYHGAGFVNSIFNGHHLCVVELTTFKDRNCSDKTVWRSHPSLTAHDRPVWPLTINPHVMWQIYGLPLHQLLSANYGNVTNCSEVVPPDRGDDIDLWVKRLHWIP